MKKPTNAELYNAIVTQRLAFERDELLPPEGVIDRFNSLIQDDVSSLSSSRRSVRTRARKRAIYIYKEVGGEVMLLIVMVLSAVDKILNVEQKLINRLKTWWPLVHHPSSLAKASEMLIVAPHDILPVSQQYSVEAAPGQEAVAALGMFFLLLLIYD